MAKANHDLIKADSGWHCSVCGWRWKGKPRGECPGVRRYVQFKEEDWQETPPQNFKPSLDLKALNLKPKGNPVGCIQRKDKGWTYLYEQQDTKRLYPYPILEEKGDLKTEDELQGLNRSPLGITPQGMVQSYGMSEWKLLYRLEDCPIADESLPPVYSWNNRPEHLETPHNLQKFNLKPGQAKPKGCVWDQRKQSWVFLYDPDSEGLEILDPSLPTCYRKEAIPLKLKTERELELLNLKLKKDASERGCYRVWEKYSKYEWNLVTVPLYSLEDCEIVDLSLPPCYDSDSYPPELKTEKELKEINLAPGEASPRGCYRVAWYGQIQTTLLYHPDDCEWKAKDQYLTKTTLRSTYLLSQGWIKRLGEPDKVLENPHHHKWSDMQLYSKQRVERFLAEHAEEYAAWLDERDRYVLIFELNRERIEAGRAAARMALIDERERQLIERQRQRLSRGIIQELGDLTNEEIRTQTTLCLRCASGCAMTEGFLCVVHPLGLEPHQIPCPDWQERGR